MLIVLTGVHQEIPNTPPSNQSVYIAPPPPSAAAPDAGASGATGSTAATGTEADRLRARYKAIGDAQNHIFGEGLPGSKPPNFNLAKPATGATAARSNGLVATPLRLQRDLRPRPAKRTAPRPAARKAPERYRRRERGARRVGRHWPFAATGAKSAPRLPARKALLARPGRRAPHLPRSGATGASPATGAPGTGVNALPLPRARRRSQPDRRAGSRARNWSNGPTGGPPR